MAYRIQPNLSGTGFEVIDIDLGEIVAERVTRRGAEDYVSDQEGDAAAQDRADAFDLTPRAAMGAARVLHRYAR